MRRSIVATMALLATGAALADSPLADVIEENRREAALELIAEGADVNAAQGDGTTPLHWATYKLDLELVQLLLDRGAKADTQNRYGATPLGEAVKSAHVPLTEALLDAGANANAANGDGETVLMLAARTGSVATTKLLLEHGADVNARELVARADGAHVGSRRRLCRAHAALGRPRRRRPRACDCERLGRADHIRAAGAVPPHRRHDGPAVRRPLRLRRVRARDPRRRRGHRSADARRRDGVDDRHRQLRVRYRQSAARRRRESALRRLVGPHGALPGRRHEHLRAPLARAPALDGNAGNRHRAATARERRRGRPAAQHAPPGPRR